MERRQTVTVVWWTVRNTVALWALLFGVLWMTGCTAGGGDAVEQAQAPPASPPTQPAAGLSSDQNQGFVLVGQR